MVRFVTAKRPRSVREAPAKRPRSVRVCPQVLAPWPKVSTITGIEPWGSQSLQLSSFLGPAKNASNDRDRAPACRVSKLPKVTRMGFGRHVAPKGRHQREERGERREERGERREERGEERREKRTGEDRRGEERRAAYV